MNRTFIIAISMLFAAALPLHAQKTLGDGIKELSTQISTSAAKQQKQKIAVLPFRELEGQPTVLGTYLAEELVTNLFQLGNFEIVERQLLDKVLGELKVEQSGAIDPSTAKEIGRVTGVDAIVTGSITDLQSFVGVNCRLIDTTTGKIFGAAQTKITKDDDVKKIMSTAVTAHSPAAPRAPAVKKASEGKPSWTGDDLRVIVDKAERHGETINLTLAFELAGSRTGAYTFGGVYLLDENGERWDGKFEEGETAYFNLLPDTRVRRRAVFRAPPAGSGGTIFTLICENWRTAVHGIVPE